MFRSVDMILTDAPFVDTLMYNLKTLALNCVIKDEEAALAAETKRSVKNANVYIKCRDDTIKYDELTYNREVLEQTSLPSELIIECLANPTKIPEEYRSELRNSMKEWYIEHYEELNSYYRMLMGLPPVDSPGIIVEDWMIPEGISVVPGTKLHELSQEVLITMDNTGILSQIYDSNTDAKYIEYMGAYTISPYEARTANNFDLLYVAEIDNESIRSRFIDMYNKNRDYVLRRVYSEAYKFESDYYNKFIMLYIVLSTMIDILSTINEFIINKEIFDSRCIRHMFESYGIPYYSEIPTKYQLKLLKNIHKLIKYKSSIQNMQDICALFGYDNIQIFKFYILKHRKLDNDGNYVFATKEVEDFETGEIKEVEDPTKEYDISFVKVPIDEQPDEYIKHMQDHITYDVVTYADYYWDGGRDHQEIKNEHLESAFGYKRTKYISIDTVTNSKELSFGMPYFLSMLYDTVKLEENLLLYIPFLNRGHYFRLTDVFCYLFAMTSFYSGLSDDIYIKQYVRLDDDNEYYVEDVKVQVDYDEMSETYSIGNMDEISNGNKYITAFNFRPDIEYLNKYFADHYVTKKDLGIADFQTPINNIVRYENLLSIFNTNKGIYDYVTDKLVTCTTKYERDIFKTIYRHMMIDEFKLDYFLQPDGTMPSTYTEYLRYRDTILYLSLKEVSSIADLETRRKEIDTIVGNVIYSVNDYIDTDEYRFLFNYMPTVSAEFVKKYIIKVIDIFKSYKLQLYDINSTYEFGSKGGGADNNRIQILEQFSDIKVKFKAKDMIEIKDETQQDVDVHFSEHIGFEDTAIISLYYEEE